MSDQEGIKIQTKILNESAHLLLVEVNGYVDQANCHALQKTIDTCLGDQFYNLIFNLENLVYMSSAGWGVLIGEIKRFRENGGDIKLANMGPDIYEIYQMLEFYHIISEYPSIEDAIKSLNIGLATGKEKKTVAKPPKKDVEKTQSPVFSEDDAKNEDEAQEKKTDLHELLNDPAYAKSEPETDPDTTSKAIIEEEIDINIDGILENEGITTSGEKTDKSNYIAFDPEKYNRKIDIKLLPIPDKIREIVGKNPKLTPREIKKVLGMPEYGELKIGYFRIKSILKGLELDTKEKRYRYFRSC